MARQDRAGESRSTPSAVLYALCYDLGTFPRQVVTWVKPKSCLPTEKRLGSNWDESSQEGEDTKRETTLGTKRGKADLVESREAVR